MECQGGDSGSFLLDMDDNVVGLVFAGGVNQDGEVVCIANKIRNVFAMLESDGEDFDVVTPSGEPIPSWSNGILADTYVDPAIETPTPATQPLAPVLVIGAFGIGALIALTFTD